MASVTTWNRLEPSPRQASMGETLAARIYDPLWLLARQWQLGEFQGEDNGTPIEVSVRGEFAHLTRYMPGPPTAAPVAGEPFDPATIALETLVEHERAMPRAGESERLHVSAEAGQHFLRLLARESFGTQYHARVVAVFPLPQLSAEATAAAAKDELKSLALLSGRVPDGSVLATAVRQAELPARLAIAPEHEGAVRRVAEAFVRWYEELFSEPASGAGVAWSPRRMEYAFAVAAPSPGPASAPVGGETVLSAREYLSGQLDWYDFDVMPQAALGAAGDRKPGQNPVPIAQTAIASPVTFRGMPAPRWWEFEDGAVDFGAVEPDPQDLARMLMLEFAIAYGNDWFVVPVDLPVGSLCRIVSLTVTDTFGVRTLIPSVAASKHPAAPTWRMFRHSIDRTAGAGSPPSDHFFLAPTLMRTMEGKPLEEVLFLRDEMANLAWGVERVVEGPTGRAVDRRQVYRERQNSISPAPSGAQKGAFAWRLASEVPDYWIPLIPVQVEAGKPAIAFRRGAALKSDGSRVQSAQGRILKSDPHDRLDIFEEEIPREGVRVTRAFQYARWFDGAPLTWIGRRKQPGRGEGSSGLKFDRAEEPAAARSAQLA